jgi:hypothetical protein
LGVPSTSWRSLRSGARCSLGSRAPKGLAGSPRRWPLPGASAARGRPPIAHAGEGEIGIMAVDCFIRGIFRVRVCRIRRCAGFLTIDWQIIWISKFRPFARPLGPIRSLRDRSLGCILFATDMRSLQDRSLGCILLLLICDPFGIGHWVVSFLLLIYDPFGIGQGKALLDRLNRWNLRSIH